MQTVGKDIGFLPGTVNEKMAPWLAPIVDNFRNQFGDLTYFDLIKKEILRKEKIRSFSKINVKKVSKRFCVKT